MADNIPPTDFAYSNTYVRFGMKITNIILADHCQEILHKVVVTFEEDDDSSYVAIQIQLRSQYSSVAIDTITFRVYLDRDQPTNRYFGFRRLDGVDLTTHPIEELRVGTGTRWTMKSLKLYMDYKEAEDRWWITVEAECVRLRHPYRRPN